MKDYLKAKLSTLPQEPGCYLMKDKRGKILYVGKAKNLKNRVNQYFVGAHDYKTTKMVSLVHDFDFVITDSEKAALILEINLIKKYRPKYNIMFIDDKTYPYIKLTNEKYPTLSVVRDIKKDRNSKYFGPYPDVFAANQTLKILRELYPLRRCKTMPKKVCLYYHLNQCLGPCEYDIDPLIYEEMSEKITKFLRGDTKETIDELYKKMYEASDNLEYEKAKLYNDSINSINYVVSKQEVDKMDNYDIDVFAYHSDKGYIAIQGFMIRSGKLLEREFKLLALYGDPDEEFISFISQYYENHIKPSEIVLPLAIDIEGLNEILDTKIVQPHKGYRKKLIDMCLNNAIKQLELKFEVAQKKYDDIEKANNQLNELLNKDISRIELFDISHISGAFTVGAMVVYEDGLPLKKDYRLYKLSTGNSDFDSMKEILYRRYFRLLSEEEIMPDCVIVDGGKPQINAAKEIISSLGLNIIILGLAKDEHHSTSILLDEDLNELEVDKDSELFFLFARMQDEVHRFAITYHKKLRKKAQTKSILDEIDGVGKVRKEKLLKHFKSFKAIKNASIQELSEVVPNNVAQNIYRVLNDSDML
ncbi:MAG: excinuclease ABC subunit UvrC [Erysipelotrichaceae bacterium]|nr:excinuclease ABC subunit UvrC [Erysipelotrichaceae bacterium]